MLTPDAAAAAMLGVASSLRELSKVPSYASREASEGIARLIDRQFATGTDPYGRRWKPLKASTIQRKGHSRINVDTENMWKGATVKPASGAGVIVTFDDEYAAYVQRVRPIVPNRGLPVAWAKVIATALANAKQRWAVASNAKIDSVDAMIELAALLNDQAAE